MSREGENEGGRARGPKNRGRSNPTPKIRNPDLFGHLGSERWDPNLFNTDPDPKVDPDLSEDPDPSRDMIPSEDLDLMVISSL